MHQIRANVIVSSSIGKPTLALCEYLSIQWKLKSQKDSLTTGTSQNSCHVSRGMIELFYWGNLLYDDNNGVLSLLILLWRPIVKTHQGYELKKTHDFFSDLYYNINK